MALEPKFVLPGQYAKCPATLLIADRIVENMSREDAKSKAVEEEFRRSAGCVKFRATASINGVAVNAVADCVKLDGAVAEVYEVKRFSGSSANVWGLAEKLIQAALYAAVVERATGRPARAYVAVYTAEGGPYIVEVPRAVAEAAVRSVRGDAWQNMPFKHIPCSLCDWRRYCPLKRRPLGRVVDPAILEATLSAARRAGLPIAPGPSEGRGPHLQTAQSAIAALHLST